MIFELSRERVRLIGAVLAEVQMFEKYTRRRPDALMVPPEFHHPGAAEICGLDVVFGDRFALIFDIEAGE